MRVIPMKENLTTEFKSDKKRYPDNFINRRACWNG